MKVSRDLLLELIKKVAPVTKTNASVIEQQCVRIDSDYTTLTVSATSGSVYVKVWSEIENGEVFHCIGNAKLLMSGLQSMKSKDVKLTKMNTTLQVQGDMSKFSVHLLSERSWPALQDFIETMTVKIQKSDVERVMHAVSNDQNFNRAMESVYLEIMEQGYRLTGLDGFRVAVRSRDVSGEKTAGIIIHKEVTEMAARLMPDEYEVVTNGDAICIKSDHAFIRSRTVDGSYPDISSLLGKPKFETVVTLNRAELLDTLALAAVMDKVVAVTGKQGGPLKITNSSAFGETDTDVMADITGKPLDAVYSIRYLSDAVKSVDDEEIKCEIVNSKAPMYIRGASYMEVVLPITKR